MNTEEFMKLVKEQCEDRPATLGDLFKFVADNWNAMVEAQRNERESTHRRALAEMLDNLWALHLYKKPQARLFSNIECCTVLEAVDAVMPNCVGGSPARNELLEHLAKSFRALGWTPECNFIKDIRNKPELVANLYKNFPEHRVKTRKVK